MYSQNNEEFYIRNYFRHFQGKLLDIGAYDGKTFSNSFALLLLGWEGVLIEPSPEIFERLKENVNGLNVQCGNFAIGTYNGKIKFYNNLNAVATTSEKDRDKWVNEDFEEIEVDIRRYDHLWSESKFDFITIDVEGLDWEILQQINPDKAGCRMICIEWNSDKELFKKFDNYFRRYKMKLLYKSAENVIYVK